MWRPSRSWRGVGRTFLADAGGEEVMALRDLDDRVLGLFSPVYPGSWFALRAGTPRSEHLLGPFGTRGSGGPRRRRRRTTRGGVLGRSSSPRSRDHRRHERARRCWWMVGNRGTAPRPGRRDPVGWRSGTGCPVRAVTAGTRQGTSGRRSTAAYRVLSRVSSCAYCRPRKRRSLEPESQRPRLASHLRWSLAGLHRALLELAVLAGLSPQFPKRRVGSIE